MPPKKAAPTKASPKIVAKKGSSAPKSSIPSTQPEATPLKHLPEGNGMSTVHVNHIFRENSL